MTGPDPAPMPPGHQAGTCPHCGTVFRSSGLYQKDGDYGVCHACLNTLIFDGGDWRTATYDEAFLADQDARVQIAKSAFRAPLPGPEETE